MSTDSPHVLVVDDEADIRELFEITLQRMDVRATSCETLGQARAALARDPYDFCLTDMRLPDGDGLELVEHVQTHLPEMPIAVITAHGNVDCAVRALKIGAFDFVSKPVDLQILRDLVRTALHMTETQGSVDRRSRDTLIGDSKPMQNIRATIVKLSRNQAPVYISGASGSGKERVARLIHEKGPRAEHAFVPVNCGAIPSELMESEFFGHRKGSFTGAVSDKDGLFQAAHQGTLFLDEVADLSLPMQVKLLRAIQERAIRPIGTQNEIPVDVRILSATHKDLAQLVEAGEFRQDLFYRINVIQLQVPALHERNEDIPELAAHLLQRQASAFGITPPVIDASAMDALMAYDFPGNVRELENILERATALCDNQRITVSDLQLPNAGIAQPMVAGSDVVMGDEFSLESYLESIERDAIEHALQATRFNKTAAAKQLGITFRALRYRLKKLGLE